MTICDTLKMMNQAKNLGLDRPCFQKFFGRWVQMRSSHDWIVWARIRDKQLKKERRYAKHSSKSRREKRLRVSKGG